MTVKLKGYSERGMVNALCDDIRFSDTSIQRLEEFLGWCKFPLTGKGHHHFSKPEFPGVKEATLLVEQSFSDYGDLDLLILIVDNADRKHALLVEAKVATDTGSPRTIEGQWRDFEAYLAGNEKKTSSLFVQLYRKQRLIEQVDDMNQVLPPDRFSRGWSLGNNRVVRQAAELLAEYRGNPWFLAIVPDPEADVDRFFANRLANPDPEVTALPNWDVSRWGYVSWRTIFGSIPGQHGEGDVQAPWYQLGRNFDWNEHQIYPLYPPSEGGLPRGFRMHQGNPVYVANPSTLTCRVVPAEQVGEYFPKSVSVPTAALLDPIEIASMVDPNTLRPIAQNVYLWDPPRGEEPRPRGRVPVPAPPLAVIVQNWGWETSKVRMVNQEHEPYGDAFHVFNHHLRSTPLNDQG